jgi:hypothetical protein
VDNGNYRVAARVFDRKGSFVRSFGSKGTGPGQFRYPVSITVGRGGETMVSDNVRRDIQVFGPEGELLQIIGPAGPPEEEVVFLF